MFTLNDSGSDLFYKLRVRARGLHLQENLLRCYLVLLAGAITKYSKTVF